MKIKETILVIIALGIALGTFFIGALAGNTAVTLLGLVCVYSGGGAVHLLP